MAKVALQLYSINDISEKDGIFASLQTAKDLGYDGVEFAGFKGKDVRELKAELDRLNLQCAGAHMGFDELEKDPEIVEKLNILGAYSVCIPYCQMETIAEAEKCGKRLAEISKIFKGTDIKFGYHNHAHEYREIGKGFLIDYIFDNCGEDVFFELDTRHVAFAGYVPTVEAIKFRGKIPVLHARDFDGTRDCAVGSGVVDFKAVVKEANGIEWFVVENGNMGSNIEELRQSATFLKENF